jgi:predicted RNA-binding Zn ribbon-like protein
VLLDPAPGESEYGSLALVNTRLIRSGGMVDLLADTPAAGAWLELHGPRRDQVSAARLRPDWASPGRTSPGRAGAGSGIVLAPAEGAQLIELRESIRALFEAYVAGRPPPPRTVAAVNAAAAAGPLVPGLMWTTGDGPRIGEQRLGRSAGTKAMAYLAADAMNLLTSPSAAELAACGAHGCIRWFLRTHASRQWCSTRCGDRVRAARHYARHHPGDTV